MWVHFTESFVKKKSRDNFFRNQPAIPLIDNPTYPIGIGHVLDYSYVSIPVIANTKPYIWIHGREYLTLPYLSQTDDWGNGTKSQWCPVHMNDNL